MEAQEFDPFNLCILSCFINISPVDFYNSTHFISGKSKKLSWQWVVQDLYRNHLITEDLTTGWSPFSEVVLRAKSEESGIFAESRGNQRNDIGKENLIWGKSKFYFFFGEHLWQWVQLLLQRNWWWNTDDPAILCFKNIFGNYAINIKTSCHKRSARFIK